MSTEQNSHVEVAQAEHTQSRDGADTRRAYIAAFASHVATLAVIDAYEAFAELPSEERDLALQAFDATVTHGIAAIRAHLDAGGVIDTSRPPIEQRTMAEQIVFCQYGNWPEEFISKYRN